MTQYFVVATLVVDGETKTQVFGPMPRLTIANMRANAIKSYFPAATTEVTETAPQGAIVVSHTSSTAKEAFGGQNRPFPQVNRPNTQPQRAVAEQAVAVDPTPLSIPPAPTIANAEGQPQRRPRKDSPGPTPPKFD